MSPHDTEQRHDKQLRGITLESVLEKRRLDQALNAKEFAVCAGVSYSTARHWFHLPGFPAIHGVIFWQDFVHWRETQSRLNSPLWEQGKSETIPATPHMPLRAVQILHDT
jgi:hypothetical protein